MQENAARTRQPRQEEKARPKTAQPDAYISGGSTKTEDGIENSGTINPFGTTAEANLGGGKGSPSVNEGALLSGSMNPVFIGARQSDHKETYESPQYEQNLGSSEYGQFLD